MIINGFEQTPTQIHLINQVRHSNFEPDLAVTLTFSEQPFVGKVNQFDTAKTGNQFDYCDNLFRNLMCKLNQKLLNRRWHKKPKSQWAQVLSVMEIGKSQNYHYHLALQSPQQSYIRYAQDIKSFWYEFKGCYAAQVKCKPITDVDGWVSYMTKHLDKENKAQLSQYSNFLN